jgi:hypothetical protein
VVGDAQAVADRLRSLRAAGIRGVVVPAVGLEVEPLLSGLAEVLALLRD